MKRENNDWKGQLHAAFNARSMDPEFGSILASGRGGGRRQRIQFYIGIFGGLSFPFSRGSKRRSSLKCIKNSFQAILSTSRSLKMHSKQHYKIFVKVIAYET